MPEPRSASKLEDSLKQSPQTQCAGSPSGVRPARLAGPINDGLSREGQRADSNKLCHSPAKRHL